MNTHALLLAMDAMQRWVQTINLRTGSIAAQPDVAGAAGQSGSFRAHRRILETVLKLNRDAGNLAKLVRRQLWGFLDAFLERGVDAEEQVVARLILQSVASSAVSASWGQI